MRKLILASASPRRKELLELLGAPFEIRTGNTEEKLTSDTPEEAVKELSLQKALAVAGEEEEETVIIGADTVVVFEGQILGKPKDEEDAESMLKMLSGKTHQVFTGVTLLQRVLGKWKQHTFAECTEVTFYPVSDEEIRAYVATKDPLDKAGSYGIQGPFGIYVREIRGNYSNVVGLPVSRILYEMKQAGIHLPK